MKMFLYSYFFSSIDLPGVKEVIPMTIQEAYDIQSNFWRKNGDYTEDELFLFTEASHFLIEETGEPRFMHDLGALYYERREYKLALKYYGMAAEHGFTPANIGLGYIWYYGRTGTVDYKKAFECFSKMRGDDNADYKLADMYKNGYYVQKDPQKYKELIERLYSRLRYTNNIQDSLPEACLRLAEIRLKEGDKDEAVRLLREGKSKLGSRIGFDPFFGNYNIMRSFVEMLYSLTEFDIKDCDIFDTYYLLQKPCLIIFNYDGVQHTVRSVLEEDGSISVKYDGEKWYRTPDDFLKKAEIDGCRLTLAAWRAKIEEVYDIV